MDEIIEYIKEREKDLDYWAKGLDDGTYSSAKETYQQVIKMLEKKQEDSKAIRTASEYEYIRKRVTRHYANKNMSDREIIEALSIEIEEYRNKIRMLEGHTHKIIEENDCPPIPIGFHIP